VSITATAAQHVRFATWRLLPFVVLLYDECLPA
jgi:hypothetical protein